MTIRPIDVPGLPENISVQRSTRRRRSVSARREGDITVVTVPQSMPTHLINEYAQSLHERLLRRAARSQRSDADLLEMAHRLRAQFLPEAPQPSSVVWSTNQQRRWGSCTPGTRRIRLSARLQQMPSHVIEYVLVHELAHLVVSNHGPQFTDLLHRYPDHVRADAFLAGVDFAANHPATPEPDACTAEDV